MTITPPSWCTETTSLFLGETESAKQLKLWQAFESSEAAAPYVDPTTKTIPYDISQVPEVKALYLNFLRDQLTQIHSSEVVNALSPKEVESRRSMLQAFEIVLAMLKALQNCMKEQSQLLSIYADWQKQYTKMMTQTPIYGPAGALAILINKSDVGSSTLGYGSITINQVVEYLYEQIAETGGPYASWTIPKDTVHNAPWTFLLQKLPNDTYALNIYISDQTITTSSGNVTIGDPNDSTTTAMIFEDIRSGTVDSTLTGYDKRDAIVKGLSAGLTAYMENMVTNHGDDIAIPWPSTISWENAASVTWNDFSKWNGSQPKNLLNIGIMGPAVGASATGSEPRFGAGAWDEQFGGYAGSTSDADVKKRQASQSYRGDVNSQLSQYVENSRANRTQVANMAQLTQSLMDQTKDALSAQKDLLTSITESLRTLLTAIFR